MCEIQISYKNVEFVFKIHLNPLIQSGIILRNMYFLLYKIWRLRVIKGDI